MKSDGESRGGWMVATVAVVVVLPSGPPIARHHASMLARHPMWNRSQYVSVLYVNGHMVVIVSFAL